MTAEPFVVGVRFNRWFVPLAWLVGMWPPHSAVTVDSRRVTVTMGWAFRAHIPAEAVATARATLAPWWLGIGVHGLRGTWAVNGSRRGTVEICLSRPQRARILGVPVRLKRLFVSVTDPAGLVAALAAQT